MRTKSRIYIKVNFVCFLLLFSVASKAEYTDSCGLYAQMLWSAADGYESAKSSYESACDPYFEYSKGNESACGSYGYERTSYDSAKSELESALSNVSIFCGTGRSVDKPYVACI